MNKKIDVYKFEKISTIATDCSTIESPVAVPGGWGSTTSKIIPFTYRALVTREFEKYCNVPLDKLLFSGCGSLTDIHKIPIRPDDPRYNFSSHEYVAIGYMAVIYNEVPEKMRDLIEGKKDLFIKLGVGEFSIWSFIKLKFQRWLKRKGNGKRINPRTT